MSASGVFTPDQVAEMRERLAELHAEFMRESDPKAWPDTHTESAKLQRYHRKQHCTHLLKMMGELHRILERVPQGPAEAVGDATAQKLAEAKRLGAAIRERMKDGLQ